MRLGLQPKGGIPCKGEIWTRRETYSYAGTPYLVIDLGATTKVESLRLVNITTGSFWDADDLNCDPRFWEKVSSGIEVK